MKKESGFSVLTADRVTDMELRKPQGSIKKHTRDVVNQGKGRFVMGTLLYIGKPDQKVLAGVVLGIQSEFLSDYVM